MIEGVEQLEIYFGRYLPQLFVAGITPFVIFSVVAFINLPVACILLVAALFTLFAPSLFQRWDSKFSLARSKAYRAFASEFLDALQGLVTLKAFGQSKAREQKLAKKFVGRKRRKVEQKSNLLLLLQYEMSIKWRCWRVLLA